MSLFAGALLVMLFVAPRFDSRGWGHDLALVAGIALGLTGLASWQRNATNPRRTLARFDRERRRRERAERKG